MKVGFIGLGLMGSPMAKNIARKGFSLSVYNRSPEKTIGFEGMATICESPAEAARNSEIIVTMVTGPDDVKEICLGKNGIVEGSKSGTIVIDMSTIGPEAAREICNELKSKGIQFIDAPVTGSTPRAISGELTIFAGGDESSFVKAKPVLESMGKDIHYMGESGSGQAIKLINNMIVASIMTAMSEGMLLADAEGLPREKVMKALENTPAMAPFMKLKMPNFVKNEFPVLFTIRNMKKDLDLAKNEAKKGRKKLPVLEEVSRLYDEGTATGLGEEDVSAVFKVLDK